MCWTIRLDFNESRDEIQRSKTSRIETELLICTSLRHKVFCKTVYRDYIGILIEYSNTCLNIISNTSEDSPNTCVQVLLFKLVIAWDRTPWTLPFSRSSLEFRKWSTFISQNSSEIISFSFRLVFWVILQTEKHR